MDWTTYPLRTGSDTPFGVVEAVSLTAYRIGGQWRPFQDVHGIPAPVEPTVIFAGGVRVTFGGAR
jgi:hypothetical protein